jgi:Rrf2 family nitric oxide-sensitive transcriptional repressor
MQLNLQTDYALRMLITLAATGRQMTVDEIARRHGISRNHLAKIAHRLQGLGHIEAQRGRGGGLRLARDPEEINVGQVVRSLESLDGFVECMGPAPGHCAIDGACGLKGALALALEDFLKRLDGYALSQLVMNPRRIAGMLGAESARSGAAGA